MYNKDTACDTSKIPETHTVPSQVLFQDVQHTHTLVVQTCFYNLGSKEMAPGYFYVFTTSVSLCKLVRNLSFISSSQCVQREAIQNCHSSGKQSKDHNNTHLDKTWQEVNCSQIQAYRQLREGSTNGE